jgi:hypothetical protein
MNQMFPNLASPLPLVLSIPNLHPLHFFNNYSAIVEADYSTTKMVDDSLAK